MTTGDNHSEAMLNYAKINLQRMSRLNKTADLNDSLKASLDQIKQAQKWYIITEGWCGDAAQNVPTIAKMANYSSKIDLELFLRDENLEIMDQFLTNGGRSIPKLIATNPNTGEVIGTWGPRPKIAQDIVLDFKKKGEGDYQEMQKDLQLWYAKDKTNSLQAEFEQLISEWDTINV